MSARHKQTCVLAGWAVPAEVLTAGEPAASLQRLGATPSVRANQLAHGAQADMHKVSHSIRATLWAAAHL